MADQLTDEQISEFKDGDDQGRNTATHQTGYSYDVFLSFCGPDTRASFTGSLYRALTSEGFKVFMDDQAMKPGDRISRTLVNAIQRSRISIVVLSQNYASSTWCLDELVVILDCMRRKKQLVWPIFYRVAPSDVRHQRKSYAEAIAKHEESFGDESHEVQKWRSALTKVAGVQGWPDTAGQYDYELIEEIVKEARTELPREQLGGCLSKVSFIQAPPFAAQAPRNQAPGNSVNQPRQPPRPSLGELRNQAQPASRPSPGDLRDPAPTTKPVVLPDHAKLVLKLDLHDDKDKQKALKASSTLSGIDAISMDMKEKKLTVIGTVDPVTVVSKLRKYWLVDIIAVGPAKEPAKEPEKKEEPKKDGEKKEEPKKDESKKDGEKKEEPKKEEGRQEGMKDEKKKEPAPDPVMEIVKARRAYNPHMTTHYYVQSMEEDPNACVIC